MTLGFYFNLHSTLFKQEYTQAMANTSRKPGEEHLRVHDSAAFPRGNL